MRIADKMTYDQVLKNVTQNRSEMYDLQNKAATQKRVTKPSDDPVAAARVLSSRIDLEGTKQYMKNLNYAQSFLDYTDQSLDELTQNLVRLKELIISQVNDASANKNTRRVIATEVDQIFNQMVKIGNRKLADRFIFAGYKTTKPPFDLNGDYRGDRGEILIGLDKENYLAMNMPGSKVFMGEGLSADGISHATSTQPATIEQFLVEIGMKESSIDSIRSEVKESGTQLRGPASAEGSTRNLGEKTSDESVPEIVAKQEALARNFREKQEAMALAEKQGDATGNLTNLAEAGTVKSDINGINLFAMVKKIGVALRTDDKTSLQNALEKIDDAISQVVLARSQVGSRDMALSGSLETLQKGKVDANDHISKLEDADAFQVVSDINKTESTLKATLATSGKMMQDSLMDFIR